MLFAAISLPLHNNMTKIVHEFCGICIQRRYIAGCFSGVWGGGLRFGEESCLYGSSYTLGMLHLFCIARHSLLGVRQGCGLQPFAACSAAGRTEEQPRSALRLFFASRFARLRGIAAQAKKIRQPSRATAAGRHAPFPVSYTIRLPAGSICARNIIPWFCPLRKYKKQG